MRPPPLLPASLVTRPDEGTSHSQPQATLAWHWSLSGLAERCDLNAIRPAGTTLLAIVRSRCGQP